MTERIQEFLRARRTEGADVEPCLVVDLEVVRDNFQSFAKALPDTRVFCRILYDCAGAEWPLSRKFGCDPEMAVDVLDLAKRLGLEPYGISFHVGSQQRKVKAWDRALAMASSVFRDCAERGINLSMVNMGGGFPT